MTTLQPITERALDLFRARIMAAAEQGDLTDKLEALMICQLENLLVAEDFPIKHHFAPGVYIREIFMPAGTIVIGHRHNTRHMNVVIQGKAAVSQHGKSELIEAPSTFVSEPGVRKVLIIIEDMIWQTVHPTEETDMDKLDVELITKSPAFSEWEKIQLESSNLIGKD